MALFRRRVRFSRRLRARYPDREHLDEIEQIHRRLQKLKRPRIHVPTLFPDYAAKGKMPRVPIKVLVLMQVAVRRGIELSESMMRDANALAYTPVWTSARSLFELSALMFDTGDKVHKLMESWDLEQYLEFSGHLDNVMLGFKSKEWQPQAPEGVELEARNILGIIRRIDRDHLKGSYLSLYELLSEVAHPNYMGMLEQYQRISGDDLHIVTFVDSPAQADIRTILIPLGNTRGTLGMLAKVVEDYDLQLKSFLDLAAAHVPQAG